MDSKIAIVTGAYGGIGSELCKFIAAEGIKLILVDRNIEKSKAFASELNRLYPSSVVDTFAVDLADHKDIARLASDILSKYKVIHYLFNNAGVLTETLQFSKYGTELHFEVNTLAPLQLVDALKPALGASGHAIVTGTSAGLSAQVKELDWQTLIKPNDFQKLFGPYARSKQSLNVITAALGRELAVDKIVLRTADPGPNQTKLTKGAGTPLWMRLFAFMLPTPDKGAKKIFDAAMSPNWGNQSGIFVSGGHVLPLADGLQNAQLQNDFLRKCRELASH